MYRVKPPVKPFTRAVVIPRIKGKRSHAAKRRRRVSLKVRRHAGQRHTLVVFRSARHIYAHILEPGGRTIFGVSTLSKEFHKGKKSTGSVESAGLIGKLVAEKAIERGFRDFVFNRNGYLYHGRVKALAEAARKAGLRF
jgi:large subunit ribosomal protein L18